MMNALLDDRLLKSRQRVRASRTYASSDAKLTKRLTDWTSANRRQTRVFTCKNATVKSANRRLEIHRRRI